MVAYDFTSAWWNFSNWLPLLRLRGNPLRWNVIVRGQFLAIETRFLAGGLGRKPAQQSEQRLDILGRPVGAARKDAFNHPPLEVGCAGGTANEPAFTQGFGRLAERQIGRSRQTRFLVER